MNFFQRASSLFADKSAAEMMKLINQSIELGASQVLSDIDFLAKEIIAWRDGDKRKDMLAGESYYQYRHAILNEGRKMIGQNGVRTEIDNLPDNRIVDNVYAGMVKQKTNYLLAKPITFKTDNEAYSNELKQIFNKGFNKKLKNMGTYAIVDGVVYLYPYYDMKGDLKFKFFRGSNFRPFYADEEREEMLFGVNYFTAVNYNGKHEEKLELVDLCAPNGLYHFQLQGGHLIPFGDNPVENYITVTKNGSTQSQGYRWSRLPIIAFKSNQDETPLLRRCKSLQDALNKMISDFANNMQEDCRNTILIIENYDGQELGQFRENLMKYGAVKVSEGGSVSTLSVEVNANNYESIRRMLRRAIIDSCFGYDAEDLKSSGSPNEMTIKSIFNNIDMDSNDIETEWQSSLEQLMFFVNAYIENKTGVSYSDEEIEFIFNRDLMIDESSIINNCKNSTGIISDKTIISNHPWVLNVDDEIAQMKEESENSTSDDYAFLKSAEALKDDKIPLEEDDTKADTQEE